MEHEPSPLGPSTAGKLAVYSALGLGGAHFGASAADADIFYTDLRGGNEIFITTANSQTQGLDVDNDGLFDFGFSFWTRTNNAFGANSFRIDMFGALGQNEVWGIDFYPQGPSLWNAIPGLPFSQSTNTPNWDVWFNFAAVAVAYTTHYPFSSFGYFTRNRRLRGIAGLRFDDPTGTRRFAWVELTHAGNLPGGFGPDDWISISQYAYAVDEPILTGQTSSNVPEPSTMTAIGLLALGAGGLAYRRRRQQEAIGDESVEATVDDKASV